MAEPISIIASVFAIATAAAQISKAISRVRTFGEVPRRVYALKNEVADLEVVLHQVGDALQQKSLALDAGHGSLKQILARTKDRLGDLAKTLERIANACATGGKAKVISRSAVWWKEKARFQKFHDDIREIKATLNVMLGASNSRELQQIQLELRRVTLLTAKSGQTNNGESTNSITQGLSYHHLALSARMDQQYHDLSGRLDSLGQLILSGRLQDEKSSSETTEDSKEATNEQSNIETLRVLVSHRIQCRGWCPCACHAKQRWKGTGPGFIQSLLGKIFIGYSGLPVLNKPCDFRGCRDQQMPSATMEYWFPWWFVSMNMKLNLKYLSNIGPQFQLTASRRVPDTSQSIAYAMQGDIEGLKYLFSQGLALPRDVSDSRGYTLMRWALYGGMHQYETVKFLISQGALVDDVSYDNVWDFIFRNKCNTAEERALRCITEKGDRDWVEEQNFPLVHRIIFGLSSKPLALELEENPNAIYVTDAQGRTALDWAAARVQLGDVALLLSWGADPNNMDVTGRTTVLHAVDTQSAECLRLLLEVGGNPNPIMPKGVFRSSPLTAAGFGGKLDMLKLLLEFGAEPNACNPEGFTALHSVARTQNVKCALVLLDSGADLNAVSSNGRTPLTTAIIHNNHKVLQLFVDRCYDFITTARLRGPQLLSVIAEYADIETISILASSYTLKLSYDLSPESIAPNQAILKERRDFSEKLSEAFEELITIVHAEETEAGSIDSLVESGLFNSARSSFQSELADAMAKLDSASVRSSDGSADGRSDGCSEYASPLL